MVAITLPDGSIRQFDHPVSGLDVAKSIGPGLAKAALAITVNGEMKDLATLIDHDVQLSIITAKSGPDALELLRHDAAHIMAEAVKELYPETQVTIGPSIENGFYYDFARPTPFTPDDLETIEKRMAEIVDRDEAITREEWDRDEAVKRLRIDARDSGGGTKRVQDSMIGGACHGLGRQGRGRASTIDSWPDSRAPRHRRSAPTTSVPPSRCSRPA